MVKTNFDTEGVHARAEEMDGLTTLGFLELMNKEDAGVAAAVRGSLPELAAVVEEVARRLGEGGRLRYVGAGSSGRLAELDASECPATFGVAPDVVVCHRVDGGAAEDDEELGRTELAVASALDAVIGISASGSTPYVVGALEAARSRGAFTVALAAQAKCRLVATAESALVVPTGAEAIAGSTRLKAGTAQKLVLNMLSTATFRRLGRLYRGRMVGVIADNQKLWKRTVGIVSDLASCSGAAAEVALREAGGDARVALLMLLRGVDAEVARERLEAAGGRLPEALRDRARGRYSDPA